MKLLFSSLLLSLASASELAKQNERGLQGSPTTPFTDASSLFDRWEMSEPQITYTDTSDTFKFEFLTASKFNTDETIEESFWNSDCMPAIANQTGYQLDGQLVYWPSKGTLPKFSMVSYIPTMEFKVDPAKFMSKGSIVNGTGPEIPKIYSGQEASCDTTGQLYSVLRDNYRCNIEMFNGTFVDPKTVFSNETVSIEACRTLCNDDANCGVFTMEDGVCSGCQVDSILDPATDEILSAEPVTYEVCDGAGTQPAPGNSRVDFCVRTSLGYVTSGNTNNIDPTDSDNSENTVNATNFQEVNFIETLVRIEYSMAAGFSVDAFSVAPKNRELFTVSENYEDALEAFLCIGTQHPEYDGTNPTWLAANWQNVTLFNNTSDQTSYSMPKPLTDYNDVGGSKKFNQGSLINVCVKVKDSFAEQGLRLQVLTDFSWKRQGGTTFDRSIGGGAGDNLIEQQAIEAQQPAGNFLTSYNPGNCLNEYWCDFASILFAQFYNTDGTVDGEGDAILQFDDGTRRNLRDGDSRKLQEDPGGAGMDISIDVNGNAEGPADLKTAGGASLGASVASLAAFIGAVLLA